MTKAFYLLFVVCSGDAASTCDSFIVDDDLPAIEDCELSGRHFRKHVSVGALGCFRNDQFFSAIEAADTLLPAARKR